MILNLHDYRDKIRGCIIGKNIGANLGLPFQWKRKLNDVTFYTDMQGPFLSSVDLDMQLLWLRALEDNGVHIGTPVLGEYFLSYASHSQSPAMADMRVGLMPPLCSMAGASRDGNGAFVRSEIWAMIAPGCPEIAAVKAFQDANIDHAAGEGLFAAMFISVIQSAAFIQDDVEALINIGLSYIPPECGVARAVQTVLECHQSQNTWMEARDQVLTHHRGHYATWEGAGISQRDWDYDLHDGKAGYDAPSNIGMIIIGLLYGGGDFARSVCTVVNCGEDTASNAATVGAILGIIDGYELIPDDWLDPIGRKLTTRTIDAHNVKQIPETISELVPRLMRLAKIMLLTYRPDVEISNTHDTKVSANELAGLPNTAMGEKITRNLYGPTYESGLITCALDYESDAFIRSGGTAKISFKLACKLKHDLILQMKWYLPGGFRLTPAASGMIRCPGGGVETTSYVFEIVAEGRVEMINRCVIEFTAPGRHTVALVPVVLLDGGLL